MFEATRILRKKSKKTKKIRKIYSFIWLFCTFKALAIDQRHLFDKILAEKSESHTPLTRVSTEPLFRLKHT
jgi:hypothetical protein